MHIKHMFSCSWCYLFTHVFRDLLACVDVEHGLGELLVTHLQLRQQNRAVLRAASVDDRELCGTQPTTTVTSDSSAGHSRQQQC